MATKNKDFSSFNKEDVPSAKGLSFGIVVSEWNEEITNNLYKGAKDTLVKYGADFNDITIFCSWKL